MKRIQKIGMLMIMLGCASGDSMTAPGGSWAAPVILAGIGAVLCMTAGSMEKRGRRK